MAKQKSVEIVVRRGALRRFDSLTRKTAELPVTLSWDRRTAQPSASPESPGAERGVAERRKTPPFTWDAADFVVVGDSQD